MRNFITIIEGAEHHEDISRLALTDPYKVASQLHKNPDLDLSEEAQKAIVEYDGEYIQFFKNPSEDVIFTAIKRDPASIRFVKHVPEDVQLYLANKHPACIRWFKRPSDAVQIAAFEGAPGCFDEIDTPCREVCFAAGERFGADIFRNNTIPTGSDWFVDLVKVVIGHSREDARRCLEIFNVIPNELLQCVFSKSPSLYKSIRALSYYDGFLDTAYRDYLKGKRREARLPTIGQHRSLGDYTPDQMTLLRWFENNGRNSISAKELRTLPWGRAPYFDNLIKATGGRDIMLADITKKTESGTLAATDDLMTKAGVSVVEWTGEQRLFGERPNKVAVYHVTGAVIKELLTDDEKNVRHLEVINTEGGHPKAPLKSRTESLVEFNVNFSKPDFNALNVTLGWVRFTVFGKDIWIDEVQSDLLNSGRPAQGEEPEHPPILDAETRAKIRDIQEAILADFIRRMRRRGAQKFYMPSLDMKRGDYKANPPASVYKDLPKKMRFHQASITGVDPKVDGRTAWVLEGVKNDARSLMETQSLKSWFGGSKIVDAAGNPLVVYHGTQTGSSLSPGGNNGRLGENQISGIYFTDNREAAEWFGSSYRGVRTRLVAAYVKIVNPFEARNLHIAMKEAGYSDAGQFTDYLKSLGHDGVIFSNGCHAGPYGSIREIIPFTSTQIKNAGQLAESSAGERASIMRNIGDEERLPNLHEIMPRRHMHPIVRAGLKSVMIYRGVPKGVTEFRPGDWVGLTLSYAQQHIRGDGHVISMRVPAEDVAWAGTDENEYYYVPRER